ncbi:unnamed protein product, partial [Prorocentrum cordatum]
GGIGQIYSRALRIDVDEFAVRQADLEREFLRSSRAESVARRRLVTGGPQKLEQVTRLEMHFDEFDPTSPSAAKGCWRWRMARRLRWLSQGRCPRRRRERPTSALAVMTDVMGENSRPLVEARRGMRSADVAGWSIAGPRTRAWLLQQLVMLGPTPVKRHRRWRQVQNLTAEDPGVDERAPLSEMLEVGGQIDQMCLPSQVLSETVRRRYPLWEEVRSTALREAEGGSGAGGAAWLDEREIFLGQKKGRGSAHVDPQLKEWVAERTQNEAAILQGRRNGREEKLLAHGVGPAGASAP